MEETVYSIKLRKESDQTNISKRSYKIGERHYRKKLKVEARRPEYPPFLSYVKSTFETSLITSFPEIATSKSCAKRIVKITVFIICVIGFIYQTIDFLHLYFSYPTVATMLVTNPFEIVQPALTFCNKNRIMRRKFCTEESDRCTFYNMVNFCQMDPRVCPYDETDIPATPLLNDTMINSTSWSVVEKFAHQYVIMSCKKYVEGKKRKCQKPYKRIPVVTPDGEPNMCYTIESLWEKPDEEPEVFSNTFYFDIRLDPAPEEYILHTEPVMIQVAIHDRRELVNPYSEGEALPAGFAYRAYVSMTEKILLLPPYDTNCTDYLKMWKENGGTGPLSQSMCIEYCKLQSLLDRGSCIDKHVTYVHNHTLCEKGVTTTTSDITENCTKNCGNACEDRKYEIRYEEIRNYNQYCVLEDAHCSVRDLRLRIDFNRFEITRFKYQPKFESVELFSYAGGYMGMWLGLSLVSFFDLIEMICHLLYYPMGRLNWTCKKIRLYFC